MNSTKDSLTCYRNFSNLPLVYENPISARCFLSILKIFSNIKKTPYLKMLNN